MNKEINSNGFEYVDLGLPSGTLWAACNVGASKPSESGLYFQWGDTNGYAKDQVGRGDGEKKFADDWSDYKWDIVGLFTKYTTLCESLELEDDAANANMGGDWHMPSPEQIQELIDNTTSTWATLEDGVKGMAFISKKDKSKFIFIPAAGYAKEGFVNDSGTDGFIWSSALSTVYIIDGQFLFFSSDGIELYCGDRGNGFSVRGVIG